VHGHARFKWRVKKGYKRERREGGWIPFERIGEVRRNPPSKPKRINTQDIFLRLLVLCHLLQLSSYSMVLVLVRSFVVHS